MSCNSICLSFNAPIHSCPSMWFLLPGPSTAYLFAFIASPWLPHVNHFGTCIGCSHFPRKSFPSRTTPLSNALPSHSASSYTHLSALNSQGIVYYFFFVLHQPCLRQRSGISVWSCSRFRVLSRTRLKSFEPGSKEMSASDAIILMREGFKTDKQKDNNENCPKFLT